MASAVPRTIAQRTSRIMVSFPVVVCRRLECKRFPEHLSRGKPVEARLWTMWTMTWTMFLGVFDPQKSLIDHIVRVFVDNVDCLLLILEINIYI